MTRARRIHKMWIFKCRELKSTPKREDLNSPLSVIASVLARRKILYYIHLSRSPFKCRLPGNMYSVYSNHHLRSTPAIVILSIPTVSHFPPDLVILRIRTCQTFNKFRSEIHSAYIIYISLFVNYYSTPTWWKS